MEEPTEAVFEIHNIMKHTTEEFRIDLTEFPKRPPKTTRISVDFKYLTENKFQITITDLGFGEYTDFTRAKSLGFKLISSECLDKRG